MRYVLLIALFVAGCDTTTKGESSKPAESHVLRAAGASVTSLNYDSRVFFDTDQSAPRPGAAGVLDALAGRLLRAEPHAQVAVLGHTDAVGGDAYNMALSRRRAEAVVAALEARGVAASRLRALGFGKRQPVASDATEAGRARNRRVEFLISPSQRAIDAVIQARPSSVGVRENRPAVQALHARKPAPLARAPLGAPVPY
ncbi:OmpA family protein [Lichenicoccus sp.]|uniref:OmpA family protein n=1 Tax=Lichenicoccus sp. TaxID=2781899 RepID=UPI003D125C47